MKNLLKTTWLISLLAATIILLCACTRGGENAQSDAPAGADETPGTEAAPKLPSPDGDTPFERYGVLQVKDGQLTCERGNPVQLRGMSSFGLQWADGYWVLTDEAFDVLAYDWQCDIIRFAMYVTEGGYRDDPALILGRLEQGIELATARGMYVMIDWHVLTPGDPTHSDYLTAGMSERDMPAGFMALRDLNPGWTGPQVFFAYIAQKYGHQGNVLYEPANEPNRIGDYGKRFDVWSNTLKPYFESVIEVIREYDEKGIIICGTDNWSQFVDAPVNDPIDDENIMYAMHFYAGTHDAGPGGGDYWLRGLTDNALAGGLAVFCTEWGSSEATGDGGPYIDYALRWVDYMSDRGISWCAWSMAQKDEISAAFNRTTSSFPDGAWRDEEVSIAGRFYRAMIKGDPVPMYTKDGQVAADPKDGVHNGDAVNLPKDAPGEFIRLPFDFESGTREGWGKEGSSAIENTDLSVAVAETQALMFPFEFLPGKNTWEDGARLGSPHWQESALSLSECYTINGFAMEVFLESERATKGSLQLCVVLVPDGGSYWHEAGRADIDPVSGGEVITGSDGVKLRKYKIFVPFSIADYGETLRVRNIVLALYNDSAGGKETDYAGNIYYDNIGFVMY